MTRHLIAGRTVLWPSCCSPLVAHGVDRLNRRLVVVLHDVGCARPVLMRSSQLFTISPRKAAA